MAGSQLYLTSPFTNAYSCDIEITVRSNLLSSTVISYSYSVSNLKTTPS